MLKSLSPVSPLVSSYVYATNGHTVSVSGSGISHSTALTRS